jgi:hypothetical protein
MVLVGMDNDSLIIISWVLCFLCLATSGSVVGLSLLMLKFALDGTIRKPYGVITRGGSEKNWSSF